MGKLEMDTAENCPPQSLNYFIQYKCELMRQMMITPLREEAGQGGNHACKMQLSP